MWILKKRYKDLVETERIVSALKTTINNLEDENKNLKIAIKERDKMLEQKKIKRVSEQIQDNSDTK